MSCWVFFGGGGWGKHILLLRIFDSRFCPRAPLGKRYNARLCSRVWKIVSDFHKSFFFHFPKSVFCVGLFRFYPCLVCFLLLHLHRTIRCASSRTNNSNSKTIKFCFWGGFVDAFLNDFLLINIKRNMKSKIYLIIEWTVPRNLMKSDDRENKIAKWKKIKHWTKIFNILNYICKQATKMKVLPIYFVSFL